MSDFTSNGLNKKVDALMDKFYGAGVASHPTIIEQINYLLFMRALSFKDEEYKQLGVDDPEKIVFDGDLSKYKWENLLTLNAEELFTALEECFRKIPDSTTNQTVRLVFRNAHIKLYDKATLRIVVHELDQFAKTMDSLEHKGQHDIFGDTYEYLLSKLSQAGTSGQFRTPRHIIEFIVSVIAPKKGETILDPAVGTAGFLVKAYEHLRNQYSSGEAGAGNFDKLSNKEHSFLFEHTFSGFDSDEDMIKFGMMNLYLHGLQNAKLLRQNTLTDTGGNRDKYDVILANPPFSGKIDRDSVVQELQMKTGATEVLFLRYMLEHTRTSGRIGVVVPEGIIFQPGEAYKKIRKLLVERGLWCVVSLPPGVFNPYAKTTKTSILFLDKEMQEKIQGVEFVKVDNDGFDLGATRTPIQDNDLPTALEIINLHKKGVSNSGHNLQHKLLSREEIGNRPAANWAVFNDYYENTSNSSIHQNTEIGSILIPKKAKITIDNDTEYKQITVKMNGKGAVLRKKILGKDIKTKAQFLASEGDFIMSKIDARNGAFSIVPDFLDGSVVTSDFPIFNVNKEIMAEDFLKIMLQSPQFIKICKITSVGTSNRKRIKIQKFLNSKIPLPTLNDQQMIISELAVHRKRVEIKKQEILEEEQKISDKITEVWGE